MIRGAKALSILKAIRKTVLKRFEISLTNRDMEKCPSRAFSNTADKFTQARNKGYRINGKVEYRKQLKIEQQKANVRKELRSTFFSNF